MRRDDIIRMARECGVDIEADTLTCYGGFVGVFAQFAALVAAAQRDELLEALTVVQAQCESMAVSDWRKWEELASPEEFERWVKSRAAHMAVQARAAIAKATA